MAVRFHCRVIFHHIVYHSCDLQSYILSQIIPDVHYILGKSSRGMGRGGSLEVDLLGCVIMYV